MSVIPWEYLLVVYRFDPDRWRDLSELDINNCVTIKEVLPTAENAKKVELLRALNGDKGAEYSYRRARFYRAGRAPAVVSGE